MVNRYVKINLKKRIIIAHAARPNVYISVLALLSLSILRLTENVSFLFSILHVFSSSARSTKVYFDQKWSKKEEKPLW